MNSWLISVVTTAACIAAIIGAYFYGLNTGGKLEQRAMLERALKVEESRRNVNAKVNASSPAALCGIIGLLDDDLAECVRRVGKANPQR